MFAIRNLSPFLLCFISASASLVVFNVQNIQAEGTGKTPEGAKVETVLLDPVDAKRSRTVPVKVYLPVSKKPVPVILFSHGLGGSREGNPYLGNHWAKNGSIVVFVQHPGSDKSVWESVARAKRLSALKEAAGVQATIDRLNDVPFVLDQLEKWNAEEGHPLHSRMDLSKLGMSGHSFGAVTTMGLSGRKYPGDRSMPESRFTAFLAMSPQPGKGLMPAEGFGHLDRPVFCMTGTKDGSPIDPTLKPETRRKVYDALPKGNKYQLVLEGAHHFAFGEGGRLNDRLRNTNHHPLILDLSTRFWDAYLKEDADEKKWLQSDAPEKLKVMSDEDVWEWK